MTTPAYRWFTSHSNMILYRTDGSTVDSFWSILSNDGFTDAVMDGQKLLNGFYLGAIELTEQQARELFPEAFK